MSTNLQRVGTPLLDMDGIATQLHIKGVLTGIDNETKEEKYSPFISLNDIKTAGMSSAMIQTIGVDNEGYPVSVADLAIAYKESDTVTTTPDRRTTVRNSVYLDEHPAAYFFSQEEGDKINDDARIAIERLNKEISDIKAEHIQLMSYLARNGLTDNYRPLAGFYDTFKAAFPLHQVGYVATAFANSTVSNVMRIKPEDIGNFTEGEYVVIVKGEDTSNQMLRSMLQIIKIQGQTLYFNGMTGFDIEADNTHIYRSYGTSFQNSFIFGDFKEQNPSNETIYTGVDDDNYQTVRKITTNHTGFATTFRINPDRAKGDNAYYLANIEVCVKKVGSPGALKCYVINAANIDNFEDPEQARNESILVAESNPLVISNSEGKVIAEFDFSQNGQYPLLDNIDQSVDTDGAKTRFCMIIEALTADSLNYYEVMFLQHYDPVTGTFSDLQSNNIVYEYKQQPALDLTPTAEYKALTTSTALNNADIFYGIRLKPIEHSVLVPSESGLYTADFKTYEPVRVNNARLTLRVAREGYFTVAATSASSNNDVADHGTIRYLEDKSYRVSDEQPYGYEGFVLVKDNYEEENRKIVIGNHVTEVENINGDIITIKTGAHIEKGEPVYPMSYLATLLCKCKTWDTVTQTFVDACDPVRVPLKISQVQPAYFKQECDKMIEEVSSNEKLLTSQRERLKDKLMISDNLVFEADLDSYDYYNEFQLQILWRTMAGRVIKSFAGRIYNLSLSLNNKIAWTKSTDESIIVSLD